MEKCILAPKSIVYRREIQGSETLLLILSEKNLIPQENNIIYQLPFSDEKIFLLRVWTYQKRQE